MADPAAVVRLSLAKALASIEAAEEELGRLDAAAGDGDHGAGMVRGLRAAAAVTTGGPAGQILAEAGMAFAGAAGGASGALVGTFISAIGQALPKEGTIDAPAVHTALQAGLVAVQRLGKAKPGDKTLVDTLAPFIDSFGAAAAEGLSVRQAWQEALPAAERGAQATAAMLSRRGRAARLGERSRGHLDPGAISMLYLLRAVDSALEEVSSDN